MADNNRLSTTTVRIELPDELLKNFRNKGLIKRSAPEIEIQDIENPVYRELLNNFYDAVIIVGEDGQIHDFNHRSLDFFGYNKDRFSNANIKSVIAGLTDSTLQDLVENTKRKLMTLIEGTCQRADQSTFPAEITVNKITLDKVTFLIFSIRNITRRKQAETSLKNAYKKLNESNILLTEKTNELDHERHLLHMLLSGVPEYISFKDENLNYHRINKAFADLLGLDDPNEAVGKNQLHFLDKKKAEQRLQQEYEILETGDPVVNQEAKFNFKGNEIWLTSSKVPIRGNDGKVSGIITISRDTTEKKKANELLVQAKIKAEEANKLKNDFIANITHELRTPLNPILGFATIVKNSYDDYIDNKNLLEEHANYILEAAVHLQNIIEDLLTIASNDNKEKDIKISTFSADSIIAEIVNLHQFQIDKNGINLKIETPDDHSILFHCDRSKLFHIMSNFLGNAVKFTPAGGNIYIRVFLEGEHMFFEIEDNGIGIAEEDQKRIFDRFVQAEKILTKSYAGTGLGLAIANELSETLGCEPYLFSEIEKGSRFGIKIPESLYKAN